MGKTKSAEKALSKIDACCKWEKINNQACVYGRKEKCEKHTVVHKRNRSRNWGTNTGKGIEDTEKGGL